MKNLPKTIKHPTLINSIVNFQGLTVNDWPGLAGLIYTDIFSLDFLTPLTEHDTHFKLEPHASLDLMRYTEMVKNANDVIGSKGLDLLGNVYAPRMAFKCICPSSK